MNRKGFTLVELLAVIAIMGILSGVAIMAVTRYLNKSKEHAYDTIFNSVKDASINYILDQNIKITVTPTSINISDLVDDGYLETPLDPNKKNEACNGNVSVVKKNSSDVETEDYQYTVNISCPSGYHSTKTFNND